MSKGPLGNKRKRTRIPKDSRRNLRLWAEGVRETILLPHLEEYAREMDAGWARERVFWRKVTNEFHARIPWTTEDHEEPVLEDWDPTQQLPPVQILPEEQERAKRKRMQRIRRWFKYRIRKTRKHRLSAGLDPTKDPFAVLLAKLSNVVAPPKARQAYQQYMHESHAEKIEPVVMERWNTLRDEDPGNLDRPAKPKAGFRAQVARDVFAALPKAEQLAIATRAKAEAEKNKQAFVSALKDPPSTAPADRQKCIDNLPDFVAPILRGIEQYTGLHSVLIVGGPMPKYGGELRTVHVSYGRNNTAAGSHFPQWDKKRFNENVLGLMSEYLATAFDQDHRKAAALPTSSDLSGAKYKIAPAGSDTLSDDDDQSQPSSSDDDTSDSEPDSDLDNASDVERRARKKRKTGPKPPTDTRIRDENGLTMDERRAANKARNDRLLAELNIPKLFPDPPSDPPSVPRPKPKPRPKTTAEPLRRSARTNAAVTAAADCALSTDDGAAGTGGVDDGAGSVADGATGTLGGPDSDESMPSATQPPSPSMPLPTPPPTQIQLPSVPAHPAPPQPGASLGPRCPDKAAQWFVDAHAEITRVALGPHFDAVILAWTRMEAASKYKASTTLLPTKGRPKQVSNWINRGQRGKRNCDTSVTNPTEYENEWQTWWNSLQPSWRKLDADGNWAMNAYGENGREWGPLYQWGVNGTLTIVASLYFWGCAVHATATAHRAQWEAAVIDVGWMLEGMATYYEKFNRRY
ncbi:hypothetical protein C8R43DRAFT_1140927 [Mycena crocata]|nr:hypothetical protein C8R43DRAFT_1140927 [Mycena crocata]